VPSADIAANRTRIGTTQPTGTGHSCGGASDAPRSFKNRKLVTKPENLGLQGSTGSKTAGCQSEKGDKRELIVVATVISRMIGAYLFSDRTEFSVPELLLASQILGTAPPNALAVAMMRMTCGLPNRSEFIPVGVCWDNLGDIGLSSVCTGWDQVYDQIVRSIAGCATKRRNESKRERPPSCLLPLPSDLAQLGNRLNHGPGDLSLTREGRPPYGFA